MYLELWMAVQDAYAEIPCDLCGQQTILANRITVNANEARLINTLIGIFDLDCARRLQVTA
jgi:hypothetical protein